MNMYFSKGWTFAGAALLWAAGACAVQGEAEERPEYPFNVPDSVMASVSVNTDVRVPINTMLLGLNANWPENLYGKIGYNHPDAGKLIRQFKPSSLRFPHGVWANFYDWECDGRRKTDDYKTPYDSSVINHPMLKYGFDGFHQLHQELQFDVLFTYNVNYDSPEKGARRLKDRSEKGFDVKWVELGNEPFWKTQRSAAIETVDDYIAVSKAHAEALKKVRPDLKISVPVHWRDAVTNPWNQPFLNEDYFDAVTIHKHLEGNNTREGLQQTLFTGQVLSDMAETFRGLFPNHPIWLTEWSTGDGEHAISVLGMVDGYLTLFENQDAYEVADYFQLNAKQPLFRYDKKTRVYTKTGFGAAYEMVRDLFEGAQRLETTVKTQELAEGRDAVRAVAVVKDGKELLLVINKTPLHVPLQVEVNGRSLEKDPMLRSLYFNDVNQIRQFTVEESPDVEIPLNKGRLVLPPLSINRIEI